jgi:intracellular multiplication protein IcmD
MKLYKLFFIFLTCSVFAAGDVTDLGGMADTLTQQFIDVASLMISVAYVAGIGFGITSIFKFKQHKDNPQQVPIGTPFAMMAISVLLIFLPAIYGPAGTSIFGANATSGSTTGDLRALPGEGGN